MEKLSREVLKKTDELVDIILSSNEYKRYMLIKKKLEDHKNIQEKIEQIRKLQQHVVKNNLTNKEEDRILKEKIKEIESIPIYNDYLNAIDDLNNYLKPIERLQDYFNNLTK